MVAHYEPEGRYRYVEHVFDRVITELDPRYIDAYWLGSLILILEGEDLDAGLRLLSKGAEHNPDNCSRSREYGRNWRRTIGCSPAPGERGCGRRGVGQ